LIVTARQIRLLFDQGTRQIGVTRAKWTLVAAVAQNPGATQRSIAAALEVSEATAGRLIDRLCASKYLERRENPNDRRGYRVYLTPAAQPVLDALEQVAKTQMNEVFKGVDASGLSRLDALLERISKNVAESRRRYGAGESDGDGLLR
jgi:MarR family transcriptional regulator for hemolysin